MQELKRGGWAEVSSSLIPVLVRQAAEETRAAVVCDLQLGEGIYGTVIIRWFRHDPEAQWDQKRRVTEPDRALAILNAIPFHSQMKGFSVSHEVDSNTMVIWVRADLPAPGAAFVVAHECRHTWQRLQGDECDQPETDAITYALRAPVEPHLQDGMVRWHSEQPVIEGEYPPREEL